MPELKSRDGRYLYADQDDGQQVVYDLWLPDGKRVVWVGDQRGTMPQLPPPVDPPAPAPGRPDAPPSPVAPGTPRLIKVTNERDGILINRGYSYYSSVYLRESDNTAWLFAGRAGALPGFWAVDLYTGQVIPHGPMLEYPGEAEGWSWTQAGEIMLCDGPRLRRVNPFTGEDRVVFDISQTHPGCDLHQSHSSDDGRTHSATVRRIVAEGRYPYIGTVVWYRGDLLWYPSLGALDESAITANGEYLIIKDGNDNQIVTLASGDVRTITDAAGAVGHSDTGEDCVVGEDDQHGACVLWTLQQPMLRHTLLQTWALGHVSVRAGKCLRADATRLSLIAMDGSGEIILCQHGMIVGPGDLYDYQVHANLSPCGRVAAWLSNKEGRFDLYLLPL